MSALVPILISSLALVFTLFSFWWMNWRAGKLSIGSLQHFSAGKVITFPGDQLNTVLIGLPLVIFNTGATPVAIESLRLVCSTRTFGILRYEAVEEPIWTLDPSEIERDTHFLPAVIRPNEVIKKNFVFSSEVTEKQFDTVLYNFELEANLFGHRKWKSLKSIQIDLRDQSRFSTFELNAYYRVYRCESELQV